MLKFKATLQIFCCVALLCSSFFSITQTAHALSVTPIRLELKADPGQTLQEHFELYNDKQETVTYYLKTYNFEVKDETGQPLFTNTPGGVASWTTSEPSITLGSKDRAGVNFNIAIPSDAEPGGYFGAIIGSTKAPDTTDAGEVAIQGEVGMLILLQVNGNFVEGADILEFNTKNKQKTFSSLPIDFYYRFQNSGNSWVKPLGDINITNIMGGTSKIVPANPDGSNVLPRSIRRFEASWLDRKGETQDSKAERPPKAPKGFWNNVTHEWKHFALGRYKAKLSLIYGEEQKHTQTSLTFWVIPWHLLGVIAAGLLILTILITIVVLFIVMMVMRKKRK